MKYYYPAIFTKEDSGLYAIDFPDIESCYTSGEDLEDAFLNAKDVLCYTLYDMEEDGKKAPLHSDVATLAVPKNAFISVIECDTSEYRRVKKGRAVNRTLTVPEWLDTRAKKAGINYSKVLQDGIKRELHITDW
jgi:predicted RNase H-like HicB family nuclease